MTDTWTHETERYRYATREDIQAFIRLLSDPEVGRWLWFTPLPSGGVEAYFGPLLDRQTDEVADGVTPRTAVFMVEDSSGEFLGQGAVVAVEASPGGFEIGFQLMPTAWGRRIGTRLGRFLCAYAIHRCDAYRIEGGCLEGNAGSVALLQKLGLQLEGTRRGYRLKQGVRHTELCFGREVNRLDVTEFRRVAEATGLTGR
jgi:ribosomal-protein-alanine N-acetyltransferase